MALMAHLKKAAKTIKQFLMDEGLNKDRLKGLDAVAGDSNITPHKVSKTIPGLKPNADLTRQIAKALSDISSDGSDPWCVYMANTQVGKRRVGFSLMNNQIFKSEPQAGGAELDGTLLAVKNNNPPVTFEGDKFRKGCWKKGDGDLGKPENVEGAATSTAFKFADPIDVPTGSIFLDHAALKFKIKGTEFFVVNVGAILHVKYKTWVDGDAWMATLKNGIQTAQALDQKLYTAVRTALLGANDLDPAVKDSIKLVFKPEKAEDFWGKGDAPPGADPGAKFETSALYKAEDAQQMKIVAILKAAVPSFLKDVSDNKDKYYKNGKAPKDDLGKQQAAVKTKLEAAGQDAKAIWKAIGEGLTDAGLKQPYGGFGNDIAKLPASATQMVSVDAIYGRLHALVKKGGVVIASEVSGPYFKTVSEGGAKQDDNEEPEKTAPKQEDNEEPKKNSPKARGQARRQRGTKKSSQGEIQTRPKGS